MNILKEMNLSVKYQNESWPLGVDRFISTFWQIEHSYDDEDRRLALPRIVTVMLSLRSVHYTSCSTTTAGTISGDQGVTLEYSAAVA